MSNFRFYYNKVKTMSPEQILEKILKRLGNKTKDYFSRKEALRYDTREITGEEAGLYSYLGDLNKEDLNFDNKKIKYLCEMYKEHRFDLLGTGWVKNSYDSISCGIESYRYDMNVEFNIKKLLSEVHYESSKRIHDLISENYIPIDWQKDFKSGFRWDEKKWFKDQRKNNPAGADVKIPWELSRLQHLPQMAAYSIYNKDLFKANIREFRDQILDFIAMNPPQTGVNWSCTMDIAIRAANMLVAYDMFYSKDSEKVLETEFRKIFVNSIYEHGKFIVENLEYAGEFSSNHYLSNIAGLIFISSYLYGIEEVDIWLAFGIQELVAEFNNQFYEDGTNFEASTSYQRLCCELVLYSVALIHGLKKEKIESLKNYSVNLWKQKPDLKERNKQKYRIIDGKIQFPLSFINKLVKAGKFSEHMTKQNGEIVQIGDNDSGRFFKFSLTGVFKQNEEIEQEYLNLKGYCDCIKTYENNEENYFDENILDHKTLHSLFNGIFSEDIIPCDNLSEKNILRILSGKKIFSMTVKDNEIKVLDGKEIKGLKHSEVTVLEPEIKSEVSLNKNLKIYFYEDSGIYILKSDRVFISVSAGRNGQNGLGGHSHNDKLSLEVNVDGKDILRDPGTYLYTPVPELRNKFRSVRSHNTIIINNEEQNRWYDESSKSLFTLKEETECSLIAINKNSIELSLKYREYIITRRITVDSQKILIEDKSNRKFSLNFYRGNYSNGYGKLILNF